MLDGLPSDDFHTQMSPSQSHSLTASTPDINLRCFGLQSWGGGAVCQENANGLEPKQIDCRVLDPVTNMFTANGTCFAAAETSLCNGNGEVELKFGSPEYIGLGALVFLLLVLLETFGSPFMRNCEVSYPSSLGNASRVTKTVRLLQSVKQSRISLYSNTAVSPKLVV